MRKRWVALVVVALLFASFFVFLFEANHALNNSSTVPVIVTGVGGSGIAVNPVTDLLYSTAELGCTSSGGVDTCHQGLYVISGKTNEVISKIPVSADGVAVDPATDMVYLATGNGVTVMNGSSNQILANVTCAAEYVAVNPESNMVYASFFNYTTFTTSSGTYYSPAGNGVTVINGATNSVVTKLTDVDAGLGAGQIAVDPVTGMVYVASVIPSLGSNGSVYSYVSVIDGANNSLVSRVRITETDGSGADGVAVDSGTNTVYVTTFTQGGPGDVAVINGDTYSVVANVPLPTGSHGVAVNQNTNTIYVTLARGSSISVISGATNAVVDNITILSHQDGQVPDSLAYDPANNTLYACLYISDYIAIVNDPFSA